MFLCGHLVWLDIIMGLKSKLNQGIHWPIATKWNLENSLQLCALSHKWVLAKNCSQIQENMALIVEKRCKQVSLMVTDDLIFMHVGQLMFSACLPVASSCLRSNYLLKKSTRRREQGKNFFCVCACFLTFQKDIIL